MNRNHIALILTLIEELKDLAMLQRWIEGTRVTTPMSAIVRGVLQAKEANIRRRQDEIHDLMFEIRRSN